MRCVETAGGLAVINRKLLVVHSRDQPELLQLPKGKVEAGETAAQAAVREVREETGKVAAIVPLALAADGLLATILRPVRRSNLAERELFTRISVYAMRIIGEVTGPTDEAWSLVPITSETAARFKYEQEGAVVTEWLLGDSAVRLAEAGLLDVPPTKAEPGD